MTEAVDPEDDAILGGKTKAQLGVFTSSGPEAEMRRSAIIEALAGLPTEQKALISKLQDVEGNGSELARLLGQPQRKTARQVERIRKVLAKKGLI